MSSVYSDIDLAEFWEPSEYALQNYIGAPLTDEVVAAVERALGYTLPASYVALMRFQNGGIPRRTRHRTREPTSWAVGHIAITGIYSIGHEPSCSLCGMTGSEFSIREWGYPPIGVYFADCPSAGHDMLCLDYRACGPTGSRGWFTSIKSGTTRSSRWPRPSRRSFAVSNMSRDPRLQLRGLEFSWHQPSQRAPTPGPAPTSGGRE
jgi:hypothetical protein